LPSKARKAFDANVREIERLLELHKQEGGSLKGRRYGLEVLNKSAIVLITSYWEAYCEDIAAEGLDHIVKHAKSADALPKELKKQLAKEIKNDKNDLKLWDLADDGWRKYLGNRLEILQERRNRNLNTPKAENIDQLFASAIGILKISNSWKLTQRLIPKRAREKLDKYIALRGSIAHGRQHSKSVKKVEVEDFFSFIKQLAAKTGREVNHHVKSVTGKPLWLTKSSSGRSTATR
jgi:hypothetical protein